MNKLLLRLMGICPKEYSETVAHIRASRDEALNLAHEHQQTVVTSLEDLQRKKWREQLNKAAQ